MKYPTAEEITEMKTRGYEPETIRQAEWQMERGQEAKKLCEVISQAFHGVKLGRGIGLRQGLALDDYADEATQAAYRETDEKEDWRLIPAEDLNGYHSSLSFFDAEGMRFHLPAFLTQDLLGGYGMGLTFHLTHAVVVDQTKFNLLSPEQRQSVRSFLLFLLSDPNEKFDHPHIQRALDEYWLGPSS
ncbi:MAG: DUF6714 family protein [Prosthecobacter sp.]